MLQSPSVTFHGNRSGNASPYCHLLPLYVLVLYKTQAADNVVLLASVFSNLHSLCDNANRVDVLDIHRFAAVGAPAAACSSLPLPTWRAWPCKQMCLAGPSVPRGAREGLKTLPLHVG